MKTPPKILFITTLMVLIIGTVNPAAAYVGPGAGLGLLGALWGLLLSVGAALFFLIMWPLRRMRKRAREKQGDAAGRPHGTV